MNSPQDHGQHIYRPDIDGLRAIAVMAVVIFHAFPSSLRGGFVGVDIFFVISGFLISDTLLKNLKNGTFGILDFYARRVRRIFPALLIVIVSSLIFGWFFLSPDDFAQLGKHSAAGGGFIANLIFWREAGYFDTTAESKILLHLWSLGIEEQFYIFWPLFLWFISRKSIRISSALLSVAAVSFLINIILTYKSPVAAFYSPIPRMWELIAGALLAARVFPKVRRKNLLAGFGFFLILGGILVINQNQYFPGFWALLPVLGTTFVIAAGADAGINKKILSHPAMVWVGLISYPLYLWHWPLLAFARSMTGSHLSSENLLALIVASMGLAWLTYRIIELPIRIRKMDITLAGTAAMMLVVLVGGLTFIQHGLIFRFPLFLQTAFEVAAQDRKIPWRVRKCYLLEDQGASEFDRECIDAGKSSVPMVFLWGDSHAAALYPGLSNLRDKEVLRIAQRTTGGCPPVLNWNPKPYPFCLDNNLANFKLINEILPDIVLLHADWTSTNLEHLVETIKRLKKEGVRRVVVIGPVPHWDDSLANVMFRYWRTFGQPLPFRSQYGLQDSTPEVDSKTRELTIKAGAEFISAYTALCNESGCLTREQENNWQPTASDYTHLTPSGSRILIDKIEKELLN